MGRIGWRPHANNPGMAGVRYRCLNPMRSLRRDGFPVEFYDSTRPRRYAAVVVQGLSCLDQPHNATPSGDRFLDEVRALKSRGVKILVDDCDNHFYNPSGDPNWTRAAERLRKLLDMADAWIASTLQVAAVFQKQSGQRRPVTIIGDGLETAASLRSESRWRDLLSWRQRRDAIRASLFARKIRAASAGGEVTCVWFGSHGSSYANGGMIDLLRIKNCVEALGREIPLSLTVVSNSRAKFEQHIAGWYIPTRYYPWDRIGYARVLEAHDIALIPVEQSEFTECKTNNRVVAALGHGLAVVADGIPSYQSFRSVTALDDWTNGLRDYARDRVLRRAHVRQGKRIIAERWSEEKIAHEWRALFEPFVRLGAEPLPDMVNAPARAKSL